MQYNNTKDSVQPQSKRLRMSCVDFTCRSAFSRMSQGIWFLLNLLLLLLLLVVASISTLCLGGWTATVASTVVIANYFSKAGMHDSAHLWPIGNLNGWQTPKSIRSEWGKIKEVKKKKKKEKNIILMPIACLDLHVTNSMSSITCVCVLAERWSAPWFSLAALHWRNSRARTSPANSTKT